MAGCLMSWTSLRSSVCLFPPFLTLFHSVSLFHTSHPTVADTRLRNASDRCLSRSASQLHLGHLFNLRQRGTLPSRPFLSLLCVLPPGFSPQTVFRHWSSVFRCTCRTSALLFRLCLSSLLFVSPLDSGSLIIFAEQHSSAAISTVSFHHH